MFMSQYCAQGWDDFCEAASLNPGGATGFGVRLLNNLVKEYYE